MRTPVWIVLALALVAAAPAPAKTLRWANDADVASLDPYAQQETFLLSFLANVYEPLVRRGRDLAIEPALATSWERIAPLVWRFELRHDVHFQDGAPFSAADVVYSFKRATADGSKLAAVLAGVKQVRAVNDRTVDFVTYAPDPILPEELTKWLIMSQTWCEAHAATQPADLMNGADNYASTHANGTGPFVIAERSVNDQTVFLPNPAWWDKPEHNLDRVVFRRIADDGARVAALTDGEIDMIYSVPRQEVDSLARTPHVRVIYGPGLRTIFLGFDQARKELTGSDVKGRNPFKDRRVREAFARAIDEDTIVAKVMRGLATPAGLLVGPGVTGFDPALNRRPDYDPEEAQRLLAEAGYPKGFSLAMDCPNDRYVNDEAICQAVAADLAKIGVHVRLNAQPRSQFFIRIFDPGYGSSFYLMGLTPEADDAEDALVELAATHSDTLHAGEYNIGGYSNPGLDRLLARLRGESDPDSRAALLHDALALVKDDVAYLPLHQTDVVWAARDNVELVQRGDDSFPLRYVRVR
jgi:peptide/nickel transport system substrate-binding protein